MSKKSTTTTPTERKAAKVLSGDTGSKVTRSFAANVVSKAGTKKAK